MIPGDPRELAALLDAYICGDVVARTVLMDWLEEQEVLRILFLIDCVRYGSTAPEQIRIGVMQARQAWVAELFPEIHLR